ncbi:MAG: glycosyltransferase family 4 protein [Alistipes sp.]
MKVLFLLLAFVDGNKSTCLYNDLVEEFRVQGHDIYPIAPALSKQTTGIYDEKNMKVLRVASGSLFSSSKIMKGITNILLPYYYASALKKYYSTTKFDLIVLATPPVTMIDLAAKIKKRDNAKVYLILRDIFPQNAVDIGMISPNGIIYHFFRAKEKKMYHLSDLIGCMSHGNIDFVKEHNSEIPATKLHLLPNWATPKNNIITDSSIKTKYGLNDKYLVMFGGNIGAPQRVENLIALAQLYRHQSDILFLVVGKGTHKVHLEHLVSDTQLKNIIILDYVPVDDYKNLVAQCDIGLISLHENFTIPNIPSKLLGYYEAKIPVLAIVDNHTDLGDILRADKSGYACVAGDTAMIKEKFDQLYNNVSLRKQMGQNGYKALCNSYTTEIAYNTIVNHLTQI